MNFFLQTLIEGLVFFALIMGFLATYAAGVRAGEKRNAPPF